MTPARTDDKGGITYQLTDGYVFSHKLEATLAKRLTEQTTVEARVDCGDRVRASRPDSVFQCRAAAPNGDTLLFEITVTDTNGGVNIKLLGSDGGARGGPGAPGRESTA